MTEHIASLPTGIEICYETFGDPEDPAALLVMGLGCPMGWWTVDFCEKLVAEGYFVIRYDNRDTGRSTKVRERVGRRQLVLGFLGRRVRAPYTISDMANDAVGLLDHLEIERAHLAGISMGGMIAQSVAIEHPERVLSLTSIMSTTGNRRVGRQSAKVLAGLLKPVGRTREGYIERSLVTARLLSSPGFAFDEAHAIERAGVTFDRGWSASGVVRQMLAVVTQPDRTKALSGVTVPTCVIHGLADPMVGSSGGRATAMAITGSEYVTIPGMAHDLPHELTETVVEAIARTASRAPLTR